MKIKVNIASLVIAFVLGQHCDWVVGGKSDILKETRVAWITREIMAVALNYSFPESRCCHVYLNPVATTLEERRLFEAFVSTYRDTYLMEIGRHSCDDYLLIASRERQVIESLHRVPTERSSTRILVLIDSRLDVESALFDASLYDNSDVDLLTRNGSYQLTHKYLNPRTFEKVATFRGTTMRSKRADFMGRKLQVSTYYNPPFCFLKRTKNKTIGGQTVQVFLADRENEMDGIELRIFLILARSLNFTYTFRKPDGRYKLCGLLSNIMLKREGDLRKEAHFEQYRAKFVFLRCSHGRRFNETAWNGGMIELMINKKVDVAFGDLWLSSETYRFVGLSEPWTQVLVSFLVPRPRWYTSFWALTRPLAPASWLLLLSSLALQLGYLGLRSRLERHGPGCWLLGCWLLGSWSPRPPAGLRAQLVLCQLSGLVLVAFYSSSLAAKLTNPDFEPRIDSLRQLVAANLTWGRPNVPPQFDLYFDLQDKYARQMPDRFVIENSVKDRSRRVLEGHHAVVGRIVGDVYFPEGPLTDVALQRLRVMKQSTGQFYTCFALQPWLLEPVNLVMMRLKESGIVLHHQQDVIHRRTGPKLREVFVEHDNFDPDRAVVLTARPLGLGFALLMLGSLLGLLMFYLEQRAAVNAIERRQKSTPRARPK